MECYTFLEVKTVDAKRGGGLQLKEGTFLQNTSIRSAVGIAFQKVDRFFFFFNEIENWISNINSQMRERCPCHRKRAWKTRYCSPSRKKESLQFAAALICEEFCQFTVVCALSEWGKRGGRVEIVVANWQQTGCDKVDFTYSLRHAH